MTDSLDSSPAGRTVHGDFVFTHERRRLRRSITEVTLHVRDNIGLDEPLHGSAVVNGDGRHRVIGEEVVADARELNCWALEARSGPGLVAVLEERLKGLLASPNALGALIPRKSPSLTRVCRPCGVRYW